MKTFLTFFRDLHEDRDGAAFIEYTALLGVILAVGILLLTQVGTWASGMWSTLCTQLDAGPGTCAPAAT
ncbi:MAG: Flp family type IVb pilin [Aestuariivirga sp.]